MCAGFDGNKHEDYIYKNIEGKKYCKSCTLKLEPPKSIKPISTKNLQKFKFKMTLKQDLFQIDRLFYKQVWDNEFYRVLSNGEIIMTKSPRCWNCFSRLGEEPNLLFFHHILEKRNFPQFRHIRENICILCPICHNQYETFPDKVPKIQRLREIRYEQLVNNNNEIN